MPRNRRVLRRLEGTIATGGAATNDGVLQLGQTEELWLLCAAYIFPTTVGGGAATYDIRLSEATPWTNGAHTERYANTATAVANKVTDVFASPIPVKLDAAGRLYLRATFNAGTTHTVTYALDFERVTGS